MISRELPPAPVVHFSHAAAYRIAATNNVAERFFHENADAIAVACQAMALEFRKGGRLLVCGDNAQRSDVSHVVVEFMHPVVMGKRALPAIALPDIANGAALRTLRVLGREHDILMLVAPSALTGAACELFVAAQAAGMTTIGLSGAPARQPTENESSAVEQTFRATEKPEAEVADVSSGSAAQRMFTVSGASHHVFVVRAADACMIQETHEMLYHVLWELVHVFFDHRAR